MGGLFSTSPDSDAVRQHPPLRRDEPQPQFAGVDLLVPFAPPEPVQIIHWIDTDRIGIVRIMTLASIKDYGDQAHASPKVRSILQFVLGVDARVRDKSTLLKNRLHSTRLCLIEPDTVRQDPPPVLIRALNALGVRDREILYWLVYKLHLLLLYHPTRFYRLCDKFLRPDKDTARDGASGLPPTVQELLLFMQPASIVDQFVVSQSSSQQ